MSKFKVNIYQLQEASAIFKEKYDQFKMNQDSLYKIALTADGSWNDDNTPIFMNCVEQDKKDMVQFHDVVYRCISSIDTFTTNLSNLLGKNGVVNAEKNLSYDEDYCKNSINIFKSCLGGLKSVKTKISDNYVKCNADREIEILKNELDYCIYSLDDILTSMANIQMVIENLVETTSKTNKNCDTVSILDNNLKYDWTPISYVKNYTDVFKETVDDEKDVKIEKLDPIRTTVESISSSSNMVVGLGQLKTRVSDVQVDFVDYNHATEAMLKSKDTVVEIEKSVEYEEKQGEMGISEQKIEDIPQQNHYHRTPSEFVNTDANIRVENNQNDYQQKQAFYQYNDNVNLSNEKVGEEFNIDNHFISNHTNVDLSNSEEEYTVNKEMGSVNGDIDPLGSLEREKYEETTNEFNTVGTSNVQVDKTEYNSDSTKLNMNNSVNVSLERENSVSE